VFGTERMIAASIARCRSGLMNFFLRWNISSPNNMEASRFHAIWLLLVSIATVIKAQTLEASIPGLASELGSFIPGSKHGLVISAGEAQFWWAEPQPGVQPLLCWRSTYPIVFGTALN
jgi:hypothetical protein